MMDYRSCAVVKRGSLEARLLVEAEVHLRAFRVPRGYWGMSETGRYYPLAWEIPHSTLAAACEKIIWRYDERSGSRLTEEQQQFVKYAREFLVLCHRIILGYTDFSLQRASSIFICQSTPRCWSFRSVDQASISF